ncbi:MAG TPA: DUF3048 domain-containing protein [Acidimicrobiales bacterium]|nr:DUF3048 domain-containing protein [Acidimicrobiales bacterium]
MADETTPGFPGAAAPGGGAGAPAAGRRGGRARHAAPSRFGKWWVIAIGVVVVLLAGAGVALAVTKSSKKKATPPQTVATTSTIPPQVCPLTGAPAPSGTVPSRAALAVKVDNYPAARPQTGLDQADIVFEEPVEGSITRLVAVFQCQTPALVGDVRSARAPDVPIADLLSKPLLVHAGGINPVIALLQSANLVDVNVLAHYSLVHVLSGREAPYNTYVSPAEVWAQYPAANTAPAPVFVYSPAPQGGTPASSVHIPFSQTNDTTWTWNAAKALWMLSYSGEPATVANGTLIGTSNVVVMHVNVTYGPWAENEIGGLEVQAQMTGTGPVTVLRNGQQITGTWSRPSLGAPMTLTSATGTTIPLQPGQSWVEIVPNSVTVTVAP